MNELSDQELLDALKRQRKRFASIHLIAFLLGPLVTAAAWRPLGPLPAVGLGFGVLLGGLLIVNRVARRLTWSPLEILAFERGLLVRLSSEAMERMAADRLRGVDVPRCVVHFQGVGLPGGSFISIVLRVTDKAAEIETRATGRGSGGVKFNRSNLPLEQVRGLCERIQAEFGSLKSADRFPVRDGFPCDLVIGLRDPVRVRRFECSLSDPNVERPIVQVAKAIHSLAPDLIGPA